MAYVLPPLPFAYDALDPVIDAQTMHLHHDKHHQAYVDATNKALEPYPELQSLTVEELLRSLNRVPENARTTVRNQGGGHANHQFFWKILTPNGSGKPNGDLAAAIDRDFGSYDAFKQRFEEAGTRQFGSGWAFLVTDPKQDFKLEIVTLPDQDSVLELGKLGLLTCDLWEHAYYLKYNNRRAEWLHAWWEVVHWEYVGERLAGFLAGRSRL